MGVHLSILCGEDPIVLGKQQEPPTNADFMRLLAIVGNSHGFPRRLIVSTVGLWMPD